MRRLTDATRVLCSCQKTVPSAVKGSQPGRKSFLLSASVPLITVFVMGILDHVESRSSFKYARRLGVPTGQNSCPLDAGRRQFQPQLRKERCMIGTADHRDGDRIEA